MHRPQRVRCSPLGRDEHVCTVVDEEVVGDTRGPLVRYTVEHNGHRYRVDADDVEPV